MPIDEMFRILRQVADAKAAWASQLKLLQRRFPSDLWSNLVEADIRRDSDAAAAWLEASLERAQAPVGVYLGLDTLNMDGGSGHNLEIGWTSNANVDGDDIGWVYEGLEYGPRHLLDGLVGMHSTYSLPQWEQQFSNADYMIFLGYSALILREALQKAAAPAPALIAWGFRDGDIFLLGRKDATTFTFIGV
ncbi:MAG: hypothetical protein ACJ8G1_21715 [Vitreoscilla sp.]